MKKCPFCAEDIQDDAIKCRYCNEFVKQSNAEKWYLKSSVLIIAFLCVGPFALPLLWINHKFSLKSKIIWTVIVVLLTYFFTIILNRSLKTINEFYSQIGF